MLKLKVVCYDDKSVKTREIELTFEQVEALALGQHWMPGEKYANVYSPMNQSRPVTIENYVNTEPRHTMNAMECVPVNAYQDLLDKFESKYHEKLSRYTEEELFYLYKLATFKPRRDSRSKTNAFVPTDILYLQLREKFFQWLRGDINPETKQEFKPLSPNVWLKLGHRFTSSFLDWKNANAA